jgi:hypothetical protein
LDQAGDLEDARTATCRWHDGRHDELVDVSIEPQGTGSRVRITHTFPSQKDGQAIRTAGWSSALEQLEQAERS